MTGSKCVGSTDTVSWSPPYSGVSTYRVVTRNTVSPPFATTTYDLPPAQTSLKFPVQLGLVNVILYASTQAHGYVQFSSVDAPGIQAPQKIQWDSYSDGQNKVGDGFVTVAFVYPSPSIYDSGNSSNVMVTVTATPGGARVTSKASLSPQYAGLGVIDTFTGLRDGVAYTFNSVATNECGSSGPAPPSAPLTPRVPGALSCTVSGSEGPPAVAHARQEIRVQAEHGLAAVSNVHAVNGTIDVPAFAVGTTAPIVVTATKSDPGQNTTWSFDLSDADGQMRHCT